LSSLYYPLPKDISTEASFTPRSEALSELEIPESEEDTSEAVPQVVVTLLSPAQEDASTGKVYPSGPTEAKWRVSTR